MTYQDAMEDLNRAAYAALRAAGKEDGAPVDALCELAAEIDSLIDHGVTRAETRMGDVWEAVWSEDGEPLTFDSEEEAEVEIAETLEDLQEAYELGDMSSPMTRDEFRIVAL